MEHTRPGHTRPRGECPACTSTWETRPATASQGLYSKTTNAKTKTKQVSNKFSHFRQKQLRRCKFLTEGSTPRRCRRVLPVTLGRHHKPFESAGTARGLSALDLVGALHALWRAERRGAREKGVDQDGRTIRDWHYQRVQSRQRGLEWVRVLRNVSRAAREGTCPTCTGYCRGRSGGGLRNGVLLFEPPWYPTEPPRAPNRVTQVPWRRSARATRPSTMKVAAYHP